MKKLKVILIIVMFIFLKSQLVSAKTLDLTLSKNEVKIGETLTIKGDNEDIMFTSDDTDIATVNENGVITGKRTGKVKIIAYKEGYKDKEFEIIVKENGNLADILVNIDDLNIDTRIDFKEKKNKTNFYCEIINTTKSANIDVIWITFSIMIKDNEILEENVELDEELEYKTEEVKFSMKNIKSGKSKEYIHNFNGEIENITLKQVVLQSGLSIVSYDAEKDISEYFGENVVDKTNDNEDNKNFDENFEENNINSNSKEKPVISGMIGENSYNGSDIYMVVYKDKSYDFTKYVSAVDKDGKKLDLSVDTSNINYDKDGVYDVIYTAMDKSGNVAKATAKVQVIVPSSQEEHADRILENIIKPSWSDKEKAIAIYKYIRKNFSYVDSNDHESWRNSATFGIKYRYGNCFVFYSYAKLLLTRCSIPNITITRSQGHGHHWWNLVYIKDYGWYHYDTTPRRISATFCLVTDKQLTEYSNKSGNSHIWEDSIYPKRGTKIINELVYGKRY